MPEAGLDLAIYAACQDCPELMTTISKPAFWEGRMEVRGTWEGRPTTDLGAFSLWPLLVVAVPG